MGAEFNFAGELDASPGRHVDVPGADRRPRKFLHKGLKLGACLGQAMEPMAAAEVLGVVVVKQAVLAVVLVGTAARAEKVESPEAAVAVLLVVTYYLVVLRCNSPTPFTTSTVAYTVVPPPTS